MEFLLKRRDGRDIAQKNRYCPVQNGMYGQPTYNPTSQTAQQNVWASDVFCILYQLLRTWTETHTVQIFRNDTQIFFHFDMLSIQTPLLSRKHISVFDLISWAW